jgi:hypothetical protein
VDDLLLNLALEMNSVVYAKEDYAKEESGLELGRGASALFAWWDVLIMKDSQKLARGSCLKWVRTL